MKEVAAYPQENPVVYIATCGEDGHPRVRPFQYMLEKDGKLFFCTSNKKDVYAQMRHCPYVELSVMAKDHSWIRVAGKVVFRDDRDVKEAILAANELVRNIYGSADNPEFVLFTLEEGGAGIYDFSGNPPKRYTL